MRNIAAAALVALTLGACQTSPIPLVPDELTRIADEEQARVALGQEPIAGAIDVNTAIAYALKYNLDQRVELMQQQVRVGELKLASYQGLPNLVAGSGYAGRNNYLASTSISILSERQSLEPSFSSERQTVVGDLTLSWNILDFGLSYVRAQQAADFVLIQEEARRRALNRIVEDTRSAFWRAIASERLLTRLNALESKTRRIMSDSRALAEERQTSPVAALSYEREVLEIRREAQRIDGELRVARSQLAALMNLPPHSNFRLDARVTGMGPLPAVSGWHGMVRLALVNRPEIREIAYRRRINEKDLDAALLELLPGINPFVGGFADSNALLYNSNWVGWGAKVTWNLLNVVKFPAKKELIEKQDVLLDERSRAMTMAIMTQIHISRLRFAQARKEYDTATRIRGIQSNLLRHVREAATADRASDQALLREEMNAIVSDVRADLAYANLQNAYGNIYASLGLDVYPPVDLERSSVAEVAAALRQTWIGRGTTRVAARDNVVASYASAAPAGAPAPAVRQ